jgi:hypothetical protein
MTHKEIIHFILEHIVHRFDIPQMLIMNQGSLLMSHQVCEFAGSLKIKLLSSPPYYAQANDQAEYSNKTLIKLIKKKIEEHPKRWHKVLSEALWAHRIKITQENLKFKCVEDMEKDKKALRSQNQRDWSPKVKS